MADKVKILVLTGPTATGKTSMSIRLAQKLGGEIISADSMQIYKYLSVGTAKATPEEMQGIPHHLMDFLEPTERFSVADYVEAANECIRDISARGRVPILVGGTGLYIDSLVKGIRFEREQYDPHLRERLERELRERGIEPLFARLKAIDPEYAEKLHPNNHVRVLRALELYEQTGRTMTQQRADSVPPERPYDDTVVVLSYPDRAQLYSRIDRRVDAMTENGLLDEARLVFDHRDSYRTAAQAIGYKEFFPFFEGTAELSACVEKLKQASRNYAKRQLTWFSGMENVCWVDAASPAAEQVISDCFNGKETAAS